MVTSRMFSEKDLKAIEAAVKLAEAGTSGEIVVHVQPAAAVYHWVYGLFAGLGAVLATGLMALIGREGHWTFNLFEIFTAQCFGALIGGCLARIPSLKRLVVPRGWLANKAHREALASFVELGVLETRDRTGILIYLSELEHRVEIVADKGIHAKLGEDYWKARADQIVMGVRAERPTEALCEAISEMGNELARHFPGRHDDTNELPNSPHVE